MLSELGAKVVGVALPPIEPQSLYVDAKISSLLEREFIQDIRNETDINEVFENGRIDYVFHLAAQALVRKSVRTPLESITTNITGTANVVLAGLDSKTVSGITVVTTDKVYENLDWVWPYRESDRLGGNDSYSASKAASELIVNALAISNNPRKIPVTTVRAGNVIGGGDWATDRLMPDIVRAFINGELAIIRDPSAVRPWQHVLDPLNGDLMLIERLWQGNAEFADAWNFGPDFYDARPVSWMVDKLTTLWGNGASWTTDKSCQPHEAHSLTLDSTKARAALHWEPILNIENALKWTFEWYRDCCKGIDPRELTLRQLRFFQEVT